MEYERIKTLPKANCHLHLTGSFTVGEVRNLARVLSIPIHNYEPLESKWFYESETPWALLKGITSSSIGLMKAIRLVVDKEVLDGTEYLELTINPSGMLRRGMTIVEISDVLLQSSFSAHSRGIVLKFKLGVNRKDGCDSIAVVRDVFLACDPSIRISVDLNGNEEKFSTKSFLPLFKALSEEGIPTSIHVGESRNDDYMFEELLATRPQRLAHATLLTETDYTMIAKSNTLLEVAVTSNISTGIVSTLSLHPLRRMLDLGIKVVIGTDDPGLFNNSMSEEILSLFEVGLTWSEIEAINNRGLALGNSRQLHV